ncbi:MAG: purine-nucleoside phosphorylase [Chitinispirillaceae bacterium]|nr:purine-nucleoside phosphorylase [Chitinispirillaceae bacterium]
MADTYTMMQEAASFIKSQSTTAPQFGVILGTGLGRLADMIEKEAVIPYETIPHFPVATAETHSGKLIMGMLSGKRVFALQGRFHFYEGYSMQQIVFPVRVMKLMGVETLIVSNACGGLNPLFQPGSIMAITDHINLLGGSPLIGPNEHRLGIRHPDMSEPYAKELLDAVNAVALKNNIRLEQGVYAALSGPSLETKAEYRMLRMIGADAVGMSTVPEVIAAVHAGIKVLGLSVVTDACLPDALEPTDIKKIVAVANRAEPILVKLIKKVLETL